MPAADAAGLDTVWVPDHLLQGIPGGAADRRDAGGLHHARLPGRPIERVRLGTAVSAVTFRPPALLIKAVSTLDVLSGGRARLGLGAGYHAEEAADMGLPLPPVRERFEHLEDTLRLARQMFDGDESAFAGPTTGSAPADQQPAPAAASVDPGRRHGEQRTLRLVARYADACNVFDIPDGGATITRKLAVLAEHCDRASAGTTSAIEKTVSTRLARTSRPARSCSGAGRWPRWASSTRCSSPGRGPRPAWPR